MTEHPITELLEDFDGDEPTMPSAIGPYRLVRLLGEGGMGRVYEAQQEAPVKRRVALKLIRPGLSSRAVLVRFRAERQALEVMDHPSIARVLDAGTTDEGRPYVVMELADGEPITAHCDRLGLDLEDRLALLLPVCEAVQHAHRKGVIHRDLKPSNLLVVEQDGKPIPKVIDFGIAKEMTAGATEAAGVTRLGELIGTPEYMSPEQASLGAIDVDTRSDVYSLGLVLYELLVGELPLSGDELRRLAFGELCRRIREAKTPRPSTRLETRGSATPSGGVASSTVAAGTRASVLRRVRGDLDSVVLKALAKDREQRYGSVGALADDLRRFLAHEPVLATPPTWSVRMRKFVRRHRVAVGATSAIASALLVGSGLAAVGLVQARRAEAEARASLATAEETSRFLVDLFRASDPRKSPGLAWTAGDLLSRGVARLDELGDEPEVQARMLETLGDVYWALGAYDDAEPLLERAVGLRQAGPAADPIRLAAAWDRLGSVFRSRGDMDQAEELHRQALALIEQTHPVDQERLGQMLNHLGIVLRLSRKYDEAAIVYERSLAVTEAFEVPPAEKVASVLNNLAQVYQASGRATEARPVMQRALAIFEGLLPANHPSLAVLHGNSSVNAKSLGDLPAAIAHSETALAIDREVLPAGHPALGDGLQGLGNARFAQGRYDDAETAYREGMSIYAAALGDDTLRTLRPRAALASLALARGDLAGALEEIAPVLEALRVNDHPAAPNDLLVQLRIEATARRLAGDHLGALETLDEIEALATAQEDDNPLALVWLDRALLALAVGEVDRAEEAFGRAESLVDCVADDPCALDRANAWSFRASYWARRGDLDRAFSALTLALEHPRRSAWLAGSPDLESLRHDPRWSELRVQIERILVTSPDPVESSLP